MAEEFDVTTAVDDTAPSSSDENNTTEVEPSSSENDVKTQGKTTEGQTVPFERFKDANDRRKIAEELLASYAAKAVVQQQKVEPTGEKKRDDFETREAWIAHIDRVASERATIAAEKAQTQTMRQIEMREVMKDPDFSLYSTEMKSIIEANPTLSPFDALTLARARSGVHEARTRETVEKEIRQDVIAKQKANVGTAQVREKKLSEADVSKTIQEKDPRTGKYKYSLDEVGAMLKGS